jgi:aminoglycoside phosphotransferase (APT) family kinase protein
MLRPDVTDGMQRATGGAATSVWRIEAKRGRRYALRVFRAHERHVLERELLALRAAGFGGVPVPQLFAVGTYDDRPAMLQAWCRGATLVSELKRRPTSALALGHAFGRLQSRIHTVAAPAELRGNWVDWPAPADSALAAQLRAVATQNGRLLHLDYHPLNVLTHGIELTAVLDWTNAHAGDPRADIARTLTILRLMPRVLRQPHAAIGILLIFELAWRAGYGAFGQDLEPFYAWAGGAMLHDLRGRFENADLEPIYRWTTTWRHRAGLPSPAH